ncbi:MAG: PorT family protein [Bacteroidia bacterium]|nr:PorT family protein [Bacteroidia bacterium]
MKTFIVSLSMLSLAAGAFAQQSKEMEVDSLKKVIKIQVEEIKRINKGDTGSGPGNYIELGNIRIYNKNKQKPCTDCKDSIIEIDSIIVKNKVSKKDKKVISNSLRLDLGFNNYLYNGSMNMPKALAPLDLNPSKSINVNLHLYDQAIRLSKNRKWWMYYGFTINYNNYRFNEDISLNKFNDSLLTLPTTTSLKKNKLTTTYLTVPFGFQFESNPDKQKRSFRLAAGPYVGYLLNAHTKQVSTKDGKDKNYSDLNIQKLAYGLNAKIGFGKVSLYGSYSLSTLFEKGKGPELYPVSFGIVINDFDF